METRKIANTMRITHGNEEMVAIPAAELSKLKLALEQMDSMLAAGKTCCDFCCDWCDFSIGWMPDDRVVNRPEIAKIDLINEVKNIERLK